MKIHELRQRKADLVARGRDILNAADANGNLTAEQQADYDATMTALNGVNAAIAREEAQMEAERQMAGVTIPSPAQRTGASGPAQSRQQNDAPRFASFGDQLVAIAQAGMNREAPRDPRLIWGAASGANEATAAEGGFLVQTDFSTTLMEQMHEMGDIASRVRRIPISANSNGIKLPAVDESSRVDGSRWGGVQAYWADEAATVTASKPKFRAVELSLQKLFGLGYATEEILADAPALESVMQQAFLEELMFKTEAAIVFGDGVGKPLGYRSSGAMITVAKESGQTAKTIVTANILNMWSRLPRRSRRNAVWLVNQDIEPQLYPLVITTGDGSTRIYTPPGTNGNASEFGLLMGRPVIPVEHAETLGSVGDIELVDLSQYLMIDKNGIQQASSMHVRFVYDEMCFRFIYRLDGKPAWNKPVTPAKGTNTQSPFINLAARA